jgi:hypothetical protein
MNWLACLELQAAAPERCRATGEQRAAAMLQIDKGDGSRAAAATDMTCRVPESTGERAMHRAMAT